MQRELLAAWLCLACVAGGCSSGDRPIQQVEDEHISANRPPSIAGSPTRSITPGDFYDFTPSAADPEGQPLAFTIANKPRWAAFSAKTGRLHGNPGREDVGEYANITITVSDGQKLTSLQAFDIKVNQHGEQSVTLSWMPPTENSDGSVLHDLAGYRIYYGRSAHSLHRSIELDNAGLTRYVVEGLSAAKWYFAMTSVNLDGIESERSTTIGKTVR